MTSGPTTLPLALISSKRNKEKKSRGVGLAQQGGFCGAGAKAKDPSDTVEASKTIAFWGW